MNKYKLEHTNNYQVDIYIAGNILTIEEVCAKFCESGACVSITPTSFIYTAGRETGAKITIINYARFPKEDIKLKTMALNLAKLLLAECCQHTCSVVDSNSSTMVTRILETEKVK